MKVKTYALKILKTKQLKHSKMSNVNYTSLKMQNYLSRSDLTQEEKKTIFKYRVRMEQYGENYRVGAPFIKCPLCHTHLDNQEMSFQCPIIRQEVDIKGNYSDIYNETIQSETIQTIVKITRFRKTTLEDQPTLPTLVGPCATPCDVLLGTSHCYK